MNRMLRSRVGIAAMAALFGVPSPASDPVGVYAIIDRVVLEPDSVSPERIQIWGAFIVQHAPGRYQSARGYLYYEANPTNRRATFIEWSDLRTLAGSNKVIGFGGRYGGNGRIREEKDRVGEPDVYPIGTGIYRDPPIWQMTERLREIHSAPRVPPPPPSGARDSHP